LASGAKRADIDLVGSIPGFPTPAVLGPVAYVAAGNRVMSLG